MTRRMDRVQGEAEAVDAEVWQIAVSRGREAVTGGAEAAVLSGSHVRGDAHAESDVDLYFIGDGPGYSLSRTGRHLVSETWASEAEYRSSLYKPASVGSAVPGWRSARIVHDTDGIAARLRDESQVWTWDDIGNVQLDAWVTGEVTGFAEEAHKLVIALERKRPTTAAVQRSILATRLAPVMSVHLRLLYDSENRLWDMVNEAMGAAWTTAQTRAWGMAGETFPVTCHAALELYVLATQEVLDGATAQQRAVMLHATEIAMSAVGRLAVEG